MSPKPGKPPEEASSYRLIRLLLIMSKIFDKTVLKRLRLLLEGNRIMPDHHCGFRQKQSTIEQACRPKELLKLTLERNGIAPRRS
jgi:hypothetical protein